MFSSTVLGGGKVIPESNEWYVVSNDYAAAEQFYAIADQMWRETNPETACCENLYKMAAQHGVFPRPATHAEGYAKLTGVPGIDGAAVAGDPDRPRHVCVGRHRAADDPDVRRNHHSHPRADAGRGDTTPPAQSPPARW